jgi:hypothetical protein
MFARNGSTLIVACVLTGFASIACAQSIEPRAYSNAPIGVNFLIAGYAYTRGDLEFESLPLTNANLRTSNAVFAYARTLDVGGMSGKFDMILPYTWLSGSADYMGEPVQRAVNGFADPLFRISVNFCGAPALSLKDFSAYRQDLIVGASLQVSVPWGQYDGERLINIGGHRWWFKPGLGVSKASGPWTLEAQAAATFFTENHDFFGGNNRAQKPIYSIQGHAIYAFESGIWTSLDGTYFAGGRSTFNGELSNDLQSNWRVGGTLALPVDVYNSIKLYASSGVSARTGNNFDLVGVAWQYRWGGGL